MTINKFLDTENVEKRVARQRRMKKKKRGRQIVRHDLNQKTEG